MSTGKGNATYNAKLNKWGYGKRIWSIRIDHEDLELAKKKGIHLAPAIRNFIKTLLYSKDPSNKQVQTEKPKWKVTKL